MEGTAQSALQWCETPGCVHKFHHIAEQNVIGSARIACLCFNDSQCSNDNWHSFGLHHPHSGYFDFQVFILRELIIIIIIIILTY